jgi:hypothetical protein
VSDLDVVIPVRVEGDMEELRYALRSIAQNLPHRKVWIVGEKPSWVTGVEYMPRPQQAMQKTTNVRLSMMAACQNPEVSANFIYTNDDIYVMRRDPSLNVARATVDGLMQHFAAKGPITAHAKTIQRAGRYLTEEHGVVEPLAYDSLHWPQIFNRFWLQLVLRECVNARVKTWATVYGNRFREPEDVRFVPNAKHSTPENWPSMEVLSSSKAWEPEMREFIQDCFQVTCKYER